MEQINLNTKGGILLLTCLFIVGCRPIKSTRDSFSKTRFCYSLANQTLENIPINIQGYYRLKQTGNASGSSEGERKDFESNVVFFDDRSFVYTFNPEALVGLLWGSYYIEGDTIKGHFIEPPGGMSWETGYVWFKIIDQTSIKELHYKYRSAILVEEFAEKRNEDMPIGQFINMDSTSYLEVYKKNWLKKRKWYWCNEEDFNAWQIQNSRK